MRTTGYFDNYVLRERPYVNLEWCVAVIANPIRHEEQPDGRHRFWGEVFLFDEPTPRVVRIVTLADGATIHNAFIDSGFRR